MIEPRRVLVTGAHGFVGQALCETLTSSAWSVRRAVRRQIAGGDFVVGDVGPESDWLQVVAGVDCVVHLIARTHIMHDESLNPLDAYRHINVAATLRLAKTAASQGVRRFVFMSSIKVNGEWTSEHPVTEKDTPQPRDAYGISKHEAEQALWQIAKETGLEVTVLRPPLVYGPGVKANFLRLMQLVARRRPLPLASIDNRRSLIYVCNLVDAIVACMEHPQAAGNTYLVSDSEAVSTPELVRQIATALGVEARLLSLPTGLLGLGAKLLRRDAEWQRIGGSLQIDSSKIRDELNWKPPFTMAQGLAQTAQWYHSQFPLKSIT